MSDDLELDELRERVEAARRIVDARKWQKLNLFVPYPKQVEFFAMGVEKQERMLRAGNQVGKSEAGAYETALHLTGLYPWDWVGYRFNRGIRAWACGESAGAVRDIQQNKLFGSPGVDELLGSGFIPKDCILGRSLGHGASGAFDTAQIRHVSGDVSSLTFKSYEQGRRKFQGEPMDWIWADEECPDEIYVEIVARTTASNGKIIITFTPITGRTRLVDMFDRNPAPHRGLVKITIYEAPYIDDPEAVLAKYPAWQRQARAYGDPVQGSGAIFTVPEDQIKFWLKPDDVIPEHWKKLWGVDFGIGHPFAAVLTAWDEQEDVFYVVDGFRVADQTKLQHIPRMRAICQFAPVAWPHDGEQREQGSGATLAEQYKHPEKFGGYEGMEGLKMLDEHATFPDGGYSTEAGVGEMVSRIDAGRFKVNGKLQEWFEEYRDYHREADKDGKTKIVRVKDDFLSATRIAVMMKRAGRPMPIQPRLRWKSSPTAKRLARAPDLDVFSGRIRG